MVRLLVRVGFILSLITSYAGIAHAVPPRPIITPQNANQLTLASRLGRGLVNSAAWSPDGAQLYVAGSEGLWQYDTRNWDRPPILIIPHSMELIAVSPDGKTIAYSLGTIIELWDMVSRQVQATLRGHREVIQDIVFSPNSRWLASTAFWHLHEIGARDPDVRIWDVAEGKLYNTYKDTPALPGFRFAQDSQSLLYATRYGPVLKLQVATGQTELITKISLDYFDYFDYLEAYTSAISPKGDLIADGGCPICQFSVFVYDTKTKTKRHFYLPEDEFVSPESMEFSFDGRLLAVGGAFGGIRLWDVQAGTRKRLTTGNVLSAYGRIMVRFSPDGMRLASIERAGVLIWDVQTGTIVRRLIHGLEVAALTTFHNQPVYATVQADGIELRDVLTDHLLRKLPGCFFCPWILSPDNKLMVLRGKQNVTVWNTQTGQLRYLVGGLARSNSPVLAVSADNRWLLTNGEQATTLTLRDLSSGRPRFRFTADAPISEAQLSPDGQRIAAIISPHESSGSTRLALWTVEAEQPYKVIEQMAGPMKFSPDGTVLAVNDVNYTESGGLFLIDMATGATRFRLPVGAVFGFQFDRQKQLVIYSWKPGVTPPIRPTLFNTETGTARFSLPSPVNLIAFNAAGTLIAADRGDSIAVIDGMTGTTLAILPTPRQRTKFLAFSPDDTLLISASDEGIVNTWSIWVVEI